MASEIHLHLPDAVIDLSASAYVVNCHSLGITYGHALSIAGTEIGVPNAANDIHRCCSQYHRENLSFLPRMSANQLSVRKLSVSLVRLRAIGPEGAVWPHNLLLQKASRVTEFDTPDITGTGFTWRYRQTREFGGGDQLKVLSGRASQKLANASRPRTTRGHPGAALKEWNEPQAGGGLIALSQSFDHGHAGSSPQPDS